LRAAAHSECSRRRLELVELGLLRGGQSEGDRLAHDAVQGDAVDSGDLFELREESRGWGRRWCVCARSLAASGRGAGRGRRARLVCGSGARVVAPQAGAAIRRCG